MAVVEVIAPSSPERTFTLLPILQSSHSAFPLFSRFGWGREGVDKDVLLGQDAWTLSPSTLTSYESVLPLEFLLFT